MVVAAVLLLRLPFLNHAIQGDDVNYLAAAQHAQIDPAHPTHVRFAFQGEMVTMQGHPHPPLNAWFQAALLAAVGEIREPLYHSAYLGFSLIAALAMWSLARRFSPNPLGATLLFAVTPAFVINGTSLESDLPFLAFWLAAIALFLRAGDGGPLLPAVLAMGLAAMAAFQAVLLVPLLALYLWQERRDWRAGWLALLMVPATLAGWQLFERVSSEQLPAQVLAGYFQTYGLQTLGNKLRNAAALGAHLGWMVFPPLAWVAFLPAAWPFAVAGAAGGALLDPHPLYWMALATGMAILGWCCRHWREFLAQWILLFFAAALVLFFAGSARYLLPLAAPLCLLAARHRRWTMAAVAAQAVLSIALAFTNAQHWDGYRRLIAEQAPDWGYRRVWVNGEWGLRFYAESAGAVPLLRGQSVRPGDVVLSSQLALPVPFTTGGGSRVLLREEPITPSLPLRLIGLGTRSAYSTAGEGFRPFDIGRGPVDIVRIETIAVRKPELEFVPMNHPAAESHIVSGIDKLEDNRYRWMAGRAVVLVKVPAQPLPVRVELFLPAQAPARRVGISVDGGAVELFPLSGPGPHSLATHPVAAKGASATVAIEVDRTFQSPGDQRVLGAILTGVGFR